MTQGLTAAERAKIEREGVVPERLKKWDWSLHLCPDWDFMLISKRFDPEGEGCVCDLTPPTAGGSDG